MASVEPSGFSSLFSMINRVNRNAMEINRTTTTERALQSENRVLGRENDRLVSENRNVRNENKVLSQENEKLNEQNSELISENRSLSQGTQLRTNSPQDPSAGNSASAGETPQVESAENSRSDAAIRGEPAVPTLTAGAGQSGPAQVGRYIDVLA
jgi:hypothetical protein